MKTEQLLVKKEITHLNAKIDRLTGLLEMFVEQGDTNYPAEGKMKKSFIKECKSIIKEIKNGKIKTHTYKSMADFTRSIS
jgi:hypothetical protein